MSRTKEITLLIADSNVTSLTELRRALAAKAPAVRTVCSDSGQRALETAAQAAPHTALADMRLQDMSGLKLLLQIKSRHPHVTTMMMSDCGSQEARKMCIEAGVDFFFEKPVDVDRLIGMLGAADEADASVFRGTLQNLSVADVLQLVCCRPSPMILRLEGPEGNGVVAVKDGHVVHAGVNGTTGEEAFYQLATWSDGLFEVTDVPDVEEQSVTQPLPQLLLGAAARSARGEGEASGDADAIASAIETFFPPEELAPDASHVWGPMAHYARPRIPSHTHRHTYRQDTRRGQMPTLRAFRYEAQDSPELRIRFRPTAATRVVTSPARDTSGRPENRSLAPVTRRIAFASAVAVVMLLAGVRYTGVFTGQYGRTLAPVLDSLIGDFIPSASSARDDIVEPSSAYTGGGAPAVRGDLSESMVAPDDAALPSSAIRSSREAAAQAMAQLPSLSVEISNRPELLSSANAIGVLSAVYERTGLRSSPWVEVIGPHGKRVGALAIRIEDAAAPIVLTEDLASALAGAGGPADITHVKLRRVNWSPGEPTKIAFTAARDLPGVHCEYWYSVGMSLEAMRTAGLAPGSTATIQGPTGYQTVRVQLVDRGRSDEVWLSEPVRDSIGAGAGSDASILLLPKT